MSGAADRARGTDESIAALRMRDEGTTYREIGQVLGVSTSQAHNLVAAARAECRRKAELIPRGPSAERPAGEEHARELLRRLSHDFTELERQALDHLDPAALGGQRIAFDGAAERLESLIRQRHGRKAGLAQALRDATIAFHGMLAATAASCEEFARHIGTWRNADTFAADALALARMISSRTRVELPAWEDDATLEPTGGGKTRLGRAARTERDLQIFLASLQGERQRDIAARFDLTDRQVRNIVDAWTRKAPLPERDVARLREALAHRVPDLAARAGSTPGPSLGRAREDVVLMLRALAAARGSAGEATAPLIIGRPGLDVEAIRTLNGSIRKTMEQAGVGKQVIEDVTALVVEHAGPDRDAEVSTA